MSVDREQVSFFMRVAREVWHLGECIVIFCKSMPQPRRKQGEEAMAPREPLSTAGRRDAGLTQIMNSADVLCRYSGTSKRPRVFLVVNAVFSYVKNANVKRRA